MLPGHPARVHHVARGPQRASERVGQLPRHADVFGAAYAHAHAHHYAGVLQLRTLRRSGGHALQQPHARSRQVADAELSHVEWHAEIGCGGREYARPHRRHLGPRSRQNGRYHAAAERGLELHQEAVVVQFQANAVAGKPQLQPRSKPRRQVQTVRGRAQQHRVWRVLGHGPGQHRGVALGVVAPEPGIVGQPDHVRAVRGQQRGVAFHAVADEHGLHVRAQPRRKLRRPAQQLQCNRARSAAQNLGDYPDRSHFTALSHRPPGRAPAPRTVRILEHVSLFQVLHQPAHRGFDRLVTRYDSLPVRLLGVNVADLGRRAFRAEQRGIVREVRGGQLLDWHGASGLQRVRAWERLRRDALGDGEQRGQRAPQPFVALVRLPLDHDLARRLVQLQPTHAGNLRQPQHLGDLGADLARLGVHAVAPAQDEIERFAAQRQRERPRRGQRVGSCERPVDEVYGAVHAHGEALHQRVRGLRRPHGVDYRLDLGVPL